MNIMSPPIDSLQRDLALTAAVMAHRDKKHAGIRPAKEPPRRKSAGVKIDDPTSTDSAIERARSIWPKTPTFSIFGADELSAAAPADANTDWLITDADETGAAPGDGCFYNCEDFGTFEVAPQTELCTPGGEPGA